MSLFRLAPAPWFALKLAILVCGMISARPLLAETLPPIDQRYAGSSQAEQSPHFQKHIVPLLGRLGCNGRACHGSFQGRGGFQLSLFGYDFKADHDALTGEEGGRVDLQDVAESLILTKPTDADIHEGGKRFDVDSWQYRVLSTWISQGAKDARSDELYLQQLVVTPNEIQFDTPSQRASLQAIAHWSDGTIEDVTPLCRFQSKDDAIATVDEQGNIVSGDTGDTHVVVYYDNAVTCVPVIRPISDKKFATDSDHPIDQLVAAKLNQLGIEPSGVCSDADFIRRASLDISGLLPNPADVREFLASTDPDKRSALIDRLLATPEHAAWWATKISDWTGNNQEKLRNALPVRDLAPAFWHRWLHTRLEQNVPYDEIVAGIVDAESREPGETYASYCEAMSDICREGGEEKFAQRSSMPLYWNRQEFQKPEERAIGFAYSFLGVRIECAQCHKHPFDRWSKDDFDQFSKLFSPIRINDNIVAADARLERNQMLEALELNSDLKGNKLRQQLGELMKSGETIPFGELTVNVQTQNKKAIEQRKKMKAKGKKLPPLAPNSGKILGSEKVALDSDPRDHLVDWLGREDNPYFARALVNRAWASYFGIGLVNPTDDMNLANPASNEPLLKHLSDEFISHDFDLRWLHRYITTSQTYARSTDVTSTNRLDRKHFSRHVPHRLSAEVIDDAIQLAALGDQASDTKRNDTFSLSIADAKTRTKANDFGLEIFGRSKRESNCDCDRSEQPSLLQAIYVRNDIDIHQTLQSPESWIVDACKTLGVAAPKTKQMVNDKFAMQAQNRKNQILGIIKQYKKQSPQQQARSRTRIEETIDKMRRKAAQVGLTVPDFDDLVNGTSDWQTPSDNVDNASAVSSSTESNKIDPEALRTLIEDAYLRTLSRFPNDDERQIAVEFVTESDQTGQNIASFMWTLLNTKEFVLSH
jgi:Protein of unknown function (DUF1549)/Protein of unknown function (DUF1553)